MNLRRQAFLEHYKNFRVSVPSGKHGLWEVRRVEMTEKEALIYNCISQVQRSDRDVTPGLYTHLVCYGDTNGNPYTETVFMSDHACEVADHEPLVSYAQQRGGLEHVLINGLGLGVAIALLEPYVQKFTIVELSRSVIHLVAPHYRQQLGDRLEIIQHDALTYQPPKSIHYDAVFHDIWAIISHNNLAEMRHLHRRYGRLTDWQQSWARIYCEREARKRKRHPERYKNEVDMKDALRFAHEVFADLP